jgi:transketolase
MVGREDSLSAVLAREFACAIRQIVLRESKRANVGHIGSALSIADILAVLYAGVLRGSSPRDDGRDRFVLSKGHAALALYAALSLRGWLDPRLLATYCADDSLLGVHPEHELPGVDFSTGSLGQGLAFGAGAALAARLQGSARRSYVLLSDAECNEGSVWESAMFAAHHHLASLTAIVDANGQQALGRTNDVLSMTPLRERWAAFGWDARDVDGHDLAALSQALEPPGGAAERPRALIAHTTFGRGVPFMESQVKWHYWPMSDEDYRIATEALRTDGCEPLSSLP